MTKWSDPRPDSGAVSAGDYEAAAIDVAREAGILARAFFEDRAALFVERKGVQDLVSRADREVEVLVEKALLQRFPNSSVLGEEGGGARDAGGPLWVVDPIDGTLNFLRGIPHWCVSIALLDEGRVKAGAIYDPMADEMFSAHEEGGARLNGEATRVSTTERFDEAVIAYGDSQRTPKEAPRRVVTALTDRNVEMRKMGAGALSSVWVAAGRVDAFFELHLNAWDALAAWHIVKEAGGRANDFLGSGGPDDDGLRHGNALLVSNAALYDELAALLR